MSDPDVERQERRAVDALVRRLRPWANAMQQPEVFAAEFIAALRDEGWRPPLGPPPARTSYADKDATKRGADAVREALAEAKTKATTPREETR